MRKLRILIVDDSTVVRRLLTLALASDTTIVVAGMAATVRCALATIPQISPDLIIISPEMSDPDASETLGELRKIYPKIPMIVFGAQTQRGANDLSLGLSE